jgi:hypothetical protein
MTTLDSIVRSALIQKNLSMHFYVRFMSWAIDALRDIELDAIGGIKSVTLTVDNLSQVKIPNDLVDWVRIGQVNGQYVINMGVTNRFNRQVNMVDGVITPYGKPPNSTNLSDFNYPFWDTWYNEHGEALGQVYGGSGTRDDEFMFIPERGVIQLSTAYAEGEKIFMDYIYTSECATSYVHRYAEGAIQAYIEYKYVMHTPRQTVYERNSAREEYYNQVRALYARTNNLTIEEVKRVRERRFMQSVKL